MRYIRFILLSLLILLILLLSVELRKCRRECGEATYISPMEDVWMYELSFEAMLQNDGIALDTVRLISLSGDTIMMGDIVDDSKLNIICRIGEYDCQACVIYAVEKIKQFVQQKSNISVALLLDNAEYSAVVEGELPIYVVDNMEIPIDAICKPYYFILESDLRIQKLFVPLRESPSVVDRWLNVVYTLFKRES